MSKYEYLCKVNSNLNINISKIATIFNKQCLNFTLYSENLFYEVVNIFANSFGKFLVNII